MDYESRRIIEALRSGIPSKTIGSYFGGARSDLLAEISEWLDMQTGGGKILTANYGEGKTHLLNTVFGMAHNKNLAVSMLSLSRETPFNNLYQLYQKIIQNTYLPHREQPGIENLISRLNPAKMTELQLFAAKGLQTDKLYYLLKAYANTDDPEIRFTLLADLSGDYMTNAQLKKIYFDIFAEKIIFPVNFAKSRHIWDYYMFISRLFSVSGLNGWVILFDEAEHIGRLGRKSRFLAYENMAKFLRPEQDGAFSIFTMTNNYATQVINGKDEWKYLAESENFNREAVEGVLVGIESAPELPPLTRDEFMKVLLKIIEFHGKAYDWKPGADAAELCEMAWDRGKLLRTKIRAAIEYLDQTYQYGDAGVITAGELDQENYTEEFLQEEADISGELL